MFNQGSYGSCVKFVIDGQQIMGLAYEKMKEAKSFIWIANYDLDPDISLVRKHGVIFNPYSYQTAKRGTCLKGYNYWSNGAKSSWIYFWQDLS